ncbi:MAG TPA: DoxX family protein [Gracilimonas sp.]|uniref:DoxX family protein n=1 Tax=Gracilimonas sp. TaxID=1974203 RepID=UPI002DB4F3E6|nr:DoxX family protein [Gracilimonas sp.]
MDTLLDPQIHRYLIGSLFTLAGILHFVRPEFFMKIMPEYLPWHKPLVFISGFFEMAGGIGLMISLLQTYAAWGLIFLLIAVFPANIEMFLKNYRKNGFTPFTWALLFRLPLQFGLIWWVYWAGIL